MWMSDIAHHHLAIAVLFIVAGHMYRTNWGIGHSIKEILEGQKGDPCSSPPARATTAFTVHDHQLARPVGCEPGAAGLAEHHRCSAHVRDACVSLHRHRLPTQLSIFTHHTWIGGFLIVGAGAHAAIAMIRDYDPAKHVDNVLDRVLKARDALISHLNWVCIWLGFHSFGLYIHNDTMRAWDVPGHVQRLRHCPEARLRAVDPGSARCCSR